MYIVCMLVFCHPINLKSIYAWAQGWNLLEDMVELEIHDVQYWSRVAGCCILKDMKIEHVALWCRDLEGMREFYSLYFGALSNQKYVNSDKNFESYFLSFEDGSRLEIMKRGDLRNRAGEAGDERVGYTHLALDAGSEARVASLTEELRRDGFRIVSEPRRTGDGYFESCILDPEGNRIEITA